MKGKMLNGFKAWRNLTVDEKLEEDWLERLNDLPMLTISGTCAGHPEARYWTEQWPVVWFQVPVGEVKLADKIICELARLRYTFVSTTPEKGRRGITIDAYHHLNGPPNWEKEATRRWWEDVITVLEAVQDSCSKGEIMTTVLRPLKSRRKWRGGAAQHCDICKHARWPNGRWRTGKCLASKGYSHCGETWPDDTMKIEQDWGSMCPQFERTCCKRRKRRGTTRKGGK